MKIGPQCPLGFLRQLVDQAWNDTGNRIHGEGVIPVFSIKIKNFKLKIEA